MDAHFFEKRPPMDEVCTACHGSRIDQEFNGKNNGTLPDVHRENYMKCGNCHSGEEMHGDGTVYANRYQVASAPECLDCHENIYGQDAVNTVQHTIHMDNVSCQVCHSGSYKNCNQCHVATDSNGFAYFQTESSWLDFKIGRNPRRDDRHPEQFVTVRHIPVDFDTFSHYTKNALSNFNLQPTWKMATPHNIRRNTPQNSSCDSCHGNAELFLTAGDVIPLYREANKNVIVPEDMIPGRMEK